MASVGGVAVPKQIGTMTLTIRDDDGIDHIEKFPNTYFMPDSPKILISPVQWAEQLQQEDDSLDEEATSITTYVTYSRLKWKGVYTKTFDHATRLPEMPVNEGFHQYSSYYSNFNKYMQDNCASFNMTDEFTKDARSNNIPLVTDDEGANDYESDDDSFGTQSNDISIHNETLFDQWQPTFDIDDQCRMISNNHSKLVTIKKVIQPCNKNEIFHSIFQWLVLVVWLCLNKLVP